MKEQNKKLNAGEGIDLRANTDSQQTGQSLSKKRTKMAERFAAIPKFLREREQWLLYTTTQRKDKDTGALKFKTLTGELTFENTGVPKLDKKPYDANRILHEGDWNQFCYASSNDSGTWCSYKTAVSVFLKRRKIHGIGFAFAEGDGLVGIDLDNCVDPDTGVITDERVKRILKQFKGAYIEYSISRTGLHIIAKGKALRSVTGKWLEVYGQTESGHSHRFFTMTGDIYREGEIKNCQSALDWLHFEFVDESAAAESKLPAFGASGTDHDRIAQMVNALPVQPYASDYEPWLKIGMALHNYGVSNDCLDLMFALWISFSEKCPEKFDESICERKWERFAKNPVSRPVTVRTLFMYAKKHGISVESAGEALDKLPLIRELSAAEEFPVDELGPIL